MTHLAILGAGGHGCVVYEAAVASRWDNISFYDDAWPASSSVMELQIKGGTKDLVNSAKLFDAVIVAIGDNQTRLRKCNYLKDNGLNLATVIHPSAVVSPSSKIGAGSVILAGAVVSANSTLGHAVIVNNASSIDHDCILEDGVHVSPGVNIGGGVRIGKCSWLGLGSNVLNSINIGRSVIVGAGAVVVKDTRDSLTVTGVPATPI